MFVKFLSFLPVIYSLIGFWMYSNVQIFDNKVIPKIRVNDVQDHQHQVIRSVFTFSPGSPFLLLAVFSTLNFIKLIINVKLSRFCGLKRKLNNCLDDLRYVKTQKFHDIIPEWEADQHISLQNTLKRAHGTTSTLKDRLKDFKDNLGYNVKGVKR